MTNFRNMVAISATAACVAISQNADAQSDQLENLLDEKPAESADTTAESETSPTDNAATDDAATDGDTRHLNATTENHKAHCRELG